jgi:hypothetical protein
MFMLSDTDLRRAPPPTPVERERALQALEELERFHAELLAARGGRPFPSAVDVLREVREESGDEPT